MRGEKSETTPALGNSSRRKTGQQTTKRKFAMQIGDGHKNRMKHLLNAWDTKKSTYLS
jgi:hypothetical protein